MQCPHCGKTIKSSNRNIIKEDLFMLLWMNVFLPCFGIGFILTALDTYTSIQLSVSDGLSYNRGVAITFVLMMIGFVYVMLYHFNKVEGKFIFYKKEYLRG